MKSITNNAIIVQTNNAIITNIAIITFDEINCENVQ